MKGGYVLLDCTGIDLHSLSNVTIAGFYDKVKEVLSMKKPIYGCNLVETDYYSAVVHPVSPVNLYVTATDTPSLDGTVTDYDLGFYKWHIHVLSDDTVYVTDEIAEQIEAAGGGGAD